MKIHTGTRFAGVAIPLFIGMASASMAGAQVRPVTRDTTLTRPGSMPMANTAAKPGEGPHHALALAYGESLGAFARAANTEAGRGQAMNMEVVRAATIEMRRSVDQMNVHHAALLASAGTAMRTPMTADSAAGMSRSTIRDSVTKPITAGARRDSTAGARDSAMGRPTMPPMRADSAMGRSKGMSMGSDSARLSGTGDVQRQMVGIEKHLMLLENEIKATAPDAAKVASHTAEILKIGDAASKGSSGTTGTPRTPGTP